MSVLMTVYNMVHNTAVNSAGNLPCFPPDNHQSSDDVYRRRVGRLRIVFTDNNARLVNINKQVSNSP